MWFVVGAVIGFCLGLVTGLGIAFWAEEMPVQPTDPARSAYLKYIKRRKP